MFTKVFKFKDVRKMTFCIKNRKKLRQEERKMIQRKLFERQSSIERMKEKFNISVQTFNL